MLATDALRLRQQELADAQARPLLAPVSSVQTPPQERYPFVFDSRNETTVVSAYVQGSQVRCQQRRETTELFLFMGWGDLGTNKRARVGAWGRVGVCVGRGFCLVDAAGKRHTLQRQAPGRSLDPSPCDARPHDQ